MITADEARAIALAMPGAEEGSHFDQPDFRVRGKIFSTLRAPDQMVLRLDPAEQRVLLAADPTTFDSAPGDWGLRGWTIVQLDSVDVDVLGDLVADSWRRLASKNAVAAYDLSLTGSGGDH